MANRVDAFLELLIKQNGSDLHLVAGNPPRMRLYGEIHPVKYRELTTAETLDLLTEIMSERVKKTFDEKGGADFAYYIDLNSRFRVNAFHHLGGVGAVFRAIPRKIMTLDDIGLPPVVKTRGKASTRSGALTGLSGGSW